MAYRVDISPSALEDAEEAYLQIKERVSLAAAGQWYEGLLKAIFSLEKFPARCPVAGVTGAMERKVHLSGFSFGN